MERLSQRVREFLTWLTAPQTRLAASVALALAAIVVVGCSSSNTNTTPTPTPSVSPTATASGTPTPTPTPVPQNVISMTYSSVPPTTDPTYGEIQGYGVLSGVPTASPPSTPAPSQVITVTHGQTIAFFNFDHVAHTASLLCQQGSPPLPCVANGMNWPTTFNNTNGASCTPILMQPITNPNFSSCTVSGGTFSLMFTTGSLIGMFYFGDFFDYQANPQMRTVIIVQ